MIRGFIFGINNIFLIFYILIFTRLLLSWVPRLDWYKQPWRFVYQSTEPYLALFRRFIPPIRMIDISPIVALLVLQIVQQLIIFALFQFV